MRNPIVLFRSNGSWEQESEFRAAAQHFPITRQRSCVPPNSLVVARYSALPFYNELEKDLANNGSKLLNSTAEHQWISSFDYYNDLKEFTPNSWDDSNFHTCSHPGPFVLKGRTNSRKAQWSKRMFAQTRAEVYDIASELANDPLIGPQGIIYREYVPLRQFEVCPLSGMPFSNEWRLFFYKGHLLSNSYYWTCASDETIAKADLPTPGFELAYKVADIAKRHTTFFVLDIAEKEDGGWVVIEVNDGQMAGCPETHWEEMYSSLKWHL